MSKKIWFILVLTGWFNLSLAQEAINLDSIPTSESRIKSTADDTIVTDRPDATESPSTIAPGFIQIETGAFYEKYEENSVKLDTYTYNTNLLRLGVLDNLEIRVGWNFVEGRSALNGQELDNRLSGFSPLLFGAKIAIAQEQGWFPEIGFLGHLNLPFTASNDYKPETTGADFRFSFAHSISDNSSLSYNLGAQWGDDSSEIAYVYTLSYGYSITSKLGAYLEVYGDLPENSKSNHYWDAGLTFLVRNNIQLDATVGKSFTEGQDILLSGGVSFRLPR